MGSYTSQEWKLLSIFIIANVCSAVTFSIQAPFYPSEAELKGVPATEYTVVFGIYELVIFVLGPVYGHIIATIGAKRMFTLGMVTAGISCALFGILGYIQERILFVTFSFVFRIMEAVGSAGFWTASFTIVSKEFPDTIASAFAVLQTSYGIGLCIGPALGGLLYTAGGFLLPFVCLALLLLISAGIAQKLLPVYSNSETGAQEDSKSSMITLLRVPSILLFTSVVFTASVSNGFILSTLEPHIRLLNLTSLETSFIFVLYGGSFAISAPIWGKVCDCGVSPRLIAMTGTLLIIVSYVFLGPTPESGLNFTLEIVIIGIIFQGIGFGAELVSTFYGIYRNALENGMPDNVSTYGLVSGLWISSLALGAFTGPSVSGVLTTHFNFDYGSIYIQVLHAIVTMMNAIFLCYSKCSRNSTSCLEGDYLNSKQGNSISKLNISYGGTSKNNLTDSSLGTSQK